MFAPLVTRFVMALVLAAFAAAAPAQQLAAGRDYNVLSPAQPTDAPGKMADWLKKQGVDADAFMKTAKSFSVESRMRRAIQMTEAYKFDGVPALAVQGKYVALASQARSPDTLLQNTDVLIAMARKEMGAAAAKK